MLNFRTFLMAFVFASLLVFEAYIVVKFDDLTVREGIIDKSGNSISKNEYLYIDSTDLIDNYGYISAKRPDLFGNVREELYLDLQGNEHHLTDYVAHYGYDFDYVKKYYFKENRAVIVDEKTGKRGYIDFDGNKVIDFKYFRAWPFENGYAIVFNVENKKSSYGVIDLDGNEIIPCKYSRLCVVSETTPFNNLVIPYSYEESSYSRKGHFTCDLFYAEDDSNNNYILDQNNEIVAKIIDSNILKFINLKDLSKLNELEIKDVRFSKNFYLITNDNNYIELYKKDGTKASNVEYKSVIIRNNINSKEEYLLVEDTDNNKYFIDKDLNVLVDINSFKDKGLDVIFINNGFARIKKDNLLGISDYDGNILVKPEYDDILMEYSGEKIFPTRLGNQYGLVDINGKTVINPTDEYKDFLFGNDEYFIAKTTNNTLSIIWRAVFILVILIECVILRKLFRFK